MTTPTHRVAAYEKYKQYLTKAQLADLLSRITGADDNLVSYDMVAKHLRARQQIETGIQMVPLKQIVGSVGRYRDFTRSFFPRAGANAERWTRLDAAMNSLEGFPPVELFKIGEVYFVRDGNHRVSVARANEATHIEAYVTEVKTDIPLTVSDFERDQWLIKAEAAEFEAQTALNQLCPDNGLRFTEPGRYALLLEHIEVHKYLRDTEHAEEGNDSSFTWQEAVISWYETVYLPVVEAIHRYGHEGLCARPARGACDQQRQADETAADEGHQRERHRPARGQQQVAQDVPQREINHGHLPDQR